mmetsp:Transcript_19334/g.44054  ORF Transcript_19334/g.44054 Transcript_19334/m.44054 type:complete len:239 (-) Transcript_19334:173-889(-)
MSSIPCLFHPSNTKVPHKSYPRTGKRGVPQQFPRRLYEMLEVESSSQSSQDFDKKIIRWSKSGRAFKISDTKTFAEILLPRYFKTSKFSSFQRNLNLYGFSKVRRGPDADMYAHPSFIRGSPSNLSELRKENTRGLKKLPQTQSSSKRTASTTSRDMLSINTQAIPPVDTFFLSKNQNIEESFSSAAPSLEDSTPSSNIRNSTTSKTSSEKEVQYQPGDGKLSILAYALSSLMETAST